MYTTYDVTSPEGLDRHPTISKINVNDKPTTQKLENVKGITTSFLPE
jgi:hypothetical protein